MRRRGPAGLFIINIDRTDNYVSVIASLQHPSPEIEIQRKTAQHSATPEQVRNQLEVHRQKMSSVEVLRCIHIELVRLSVRFIRMVRT